ncbi:hypothetical protein QBC37DRAFT_371655 [Rhypophila decipiens]|uniref:Uncharacterized protein n=1 Tax=Rhypophila decipiens TaxID=261697 RepID=A0AAN6YAL0_9PEZI|nr:hypothetical protein QBC37DRAFT_371655 [Rhypophila decipiens]
MDQSVTSPNHNVHLQSSGPCIVCNGTTAHDQQAESSTVHPSCLSRISSLAFPSSGNGAVIDHENMSSSCSSISTSSSVTNILGGVQQLWLCRNCNQLQSPLNFPAINDETDDQSYTYSNHSQICYDCSIDMLDFDFVSFAASDASDSTAYDYHAGGSSSTDSNMFPAFPQRTTESWACHYCQQPKGLQEFSSYLELDGCGIAGSEDTIMCNDCMANIDFKNDDGQQQFPGWDTAAGYDLGFSPLAIDTAYLENSDYHGLPEAGIGSLSSSNTNNNYNYNDNQTQAVPSISRAGNTNPAAMAASTEKGHPSSARTKRKQTRRPKSSTRPPTTSNTTGTETGTAASSNEPYTEPVIQWISRRDPLPPNVCSRCRCRYVRPGKKQCQHCAYDYRGTRDHRASMGLCITCAEPLERDVVDSAPVTTNPQAGENTASETGLGSGSRVTKPRRSCKACREKNRLKKAADKAARLRMMAAEGASGREGMGEGSIHDGEVVNGGMVGEGERFMYRTSS